MDLTRDFGNRFTKGIQRTSESPLMPRISKRVYSGAIVNDKIVYNSLVLFMICDDYAL